MAVRCKLDTCGIKLKLNQWNEFSLSDRQLLVDTPCQPPDEIESYRTLLASLITRCSQSEVKTLAVDPNPAWLNETLIPKQLQAVAQDRANLSLSTEQWRSLSPLQRFALIKLSRPGHESHNFIPALKEFGLMES